ncbi:GNAT family N-acetyltransferase [Inediibacterium massiliense]|uniref:GNAT family N-acetyltransferase n=1 Tax=Inediibacterium massiliense TaxID=1658111 RepID=UPI0006B58094|nr:GNAT family N-acetyltransferase [Inediibacterium massiliense]
MRLRGEKVCIRDLDREDVDKMQCWGKHEDPLFFHYNFPKLSKRQRDEWYKQKTQKFTKRSFTIENKEGRVVGYFSIRDIKWIRKKSELGIVLDPDCINCGYGTETLLLFLDYYFKVLNMKSIVLRTAKFNERAIHCYLHCGFKKIKEDLDEFEDQYSEIFYNPLYTQFQKLFTDRNGKKMITYVYMENTKETFYQKFKGFFTKTMVSVE